MQLQDSGMVMLRWRLNEVMARLRITNKELGSELGRHETSVSRLRSSDEMPRLDGNSLNSLCVALTVISRKRGIPGSIGPADLFDFTPDMDLSPVTKPESEQSAHGDQGDIGSQGAEVTSQLALHAIFDHPAAA